MTWRWWRRKRHGPIDPTSKIAVQDAQRKLDETRASTARVDRAARALTDQIYVRNRLGEVIESALRGQR